MSSRSVFLAALGAAGLAAVSAASAVTLSLSGPGTAQQGSAVTFDVVFSDIDDVDEVIFSHNVFVAFDTNFLSLQSVTFGNGITTDPADRDYDPTADYQHPITGWAYGGVDYGDGSGLVYQQNSVATAEELYNGTGGYGGQAGSFTAFSLTFKVLAYAVGSTTLALIDDTSYPAFFLTNPREYTFDYIMGTSNPWYPYPDQNNHGVVTADLTVALPAPLALVGLGFGLLAWGRRPRRAV